MKHFLVFYFNNVPIFL